MPTSTSNVITLSFQKKRDAKTSQQELEKLIDRVIDEQYAGQYCRMLTDFCVDQLSEPKLQLIDWCEEKLGAIDASRVVSIF